MRSLIFALQFLTRLPTPALKAPEPDLLAISAKWFPFVGLVIGSLLALTLAFSAKIDPWFGALLTLLGWVWITGGMHIDGLADLADALGAAHRNPARLIAIMRDPHIGSFGVLAINLLLINKLIFLMLLAQALSSFWVIALIPAWARYGTMVWSQTLPPLAEGLGKRFSLRPSRLPLFAWGIGLLGISWLTAPVLLTAPFALAFWWLFLKYRLQGMNGDCLGAGVEIIETMLLAVAIAYHRFYT